MKIYKKSINYGLLIIALLVIGALSPERSLAYNSNCSAIGCTYTSATPIYDNPVPTIDSVVPISSTLGMGTKTLTITGNGFVPSSIVRINGVNRSATFIDDSHLLMQVTGDDMYVYRTNGGFFISVFNDAPGGGYSNAIFFTVNNAPGQTTANTQNANSTDFTNMNPNGNGDVNSLKNLASNAIYGSNSFMPSGIIQWVFFAILVLFVVILVRKAYGGKEKYHATPLKHD